MLRSIPTPISFDGEKCFSCVPYFRHFEFTFVGDKVAAMRSENVDEIPACLIFREAEGYRGFAFDHEEQRKSFLALLKISGVGTNVAKSVLDDHTDLCAPSDLMKVKGVGKKTAQKIADHFNGVKNKEKKTASQM